MLKNTFIGDKTIECYRSPNTSETTTVVHTTTSHNLPSEPNCYFSTVTELIDSEEFTKIYFCYRSSALRACSITA